MNSISTGLLGKRANIQQSEKEMLDFNAKLKSLVEDNGFRQNNLSQNSPKYCKRERGGSTMEQNKNEKEFYSPTKDGDLRSPLRHTEDYDNARHQNRSTKRYSSGRKRKNGPLAERFAKHTSSIKECKETHPERKASSSDWFDQVERSNELAEEAQHHKIVCEKRAKRLSESIHDTPLSETAVEEDTVVLMRREKQLEYGKNTIGYDNYISQIPKQKRTKFHPKTPDKFVKCSRRSWDAQVKIWRKALHNWEDYANTMKQKYEAKKKDKLEILSESEPEDNASNKEGCGYTIDVTGAVESSVSDVSTRRFDDDDVLVLDLDNDEDLL